jgi:hypothetical protein
MADEPKPVDPPLPQSGDSWLPGALAIALVAAFIGTLFAPYLVSVDVTSDPTFERSRMTLENVLLIVVGFYFGSNYGSRRKTELLAEKK